MSDEWFDVINEEGRIIGRARRDVCHGHPGLMHGAVHVLVVNRDGHLFLQKRSLAKDLQPGKWDTSVGGHLQAGESPAVGARRELHEELGITADDLAPAYTYTWRSAIETERIHTFLLHHEGPFQLNPHEISEGRFWPSDEIEARLNDGIFTEQFTREYERMRGYLRRETARHA